MTGVVILLVLIFASLLFAPGGGSSEDMSLDNHRIHGQCRVLYDDGFLSQPFMPKTAKFYAEHFGGAVVSRNYNGPHRVLPGGHWVNR